MISIRTILAGLCGFLILIISPVYGQSTGNKQDTLYLKNGKIITGTMLSIVNGVVEIETGRGFQTLTRFIGTSKIDHVGVSSENRFNTLKLNKAIEGNSKGYFNEAEDTRTPGQELQKFTRHYYTGIVLEIFGTGLTYAGLTGFDSYDDQVKNQAKAVMVIGGLTSLVGIIFALESFSHIGSAGRLLDQQNKISLIMPESQPGIGIRYNFGMKKNP